MVRKWNAGRNRSFGSRPSVASEHEKWKVHPVAVAGGTVVATLAACIAVFVQIVIPTEMASLRDEARRAIDHAAALQQKLTSSEASRTALGQKDKTLENEVADLKAQLISARAGALFVRGDPYPIRFRLIRIGDSVDKVYKVFPSEAIKAHKYGLRSLTVSLKESPFDEVSYSYEKGDPNKRIDHIVFNLDYRQKYPSDFLISKVSAVLGVPSSHPADGDYKWDVSQNVDVYIFDGSYQIMTPKLVPVFWPDR